MKKMTFYQQLDTMDCGPTCLRMIAKYYGKTYSLQTIRGRSYLSKEGVSLNGISEAAQSLGFQTTGVRITFRQLVEKAKLPCIAHWKQNHFIVVYKIDKTNVYIADPAFGLSKYSHSDFQNSWESIQNQYDKKGICLLLKPTSKFYSFIDEKVKDSGFRYILKQAENFKKPFWYLLFALLTSCILNFFFPFLTKSIVDKGITNKDFNFIYLVLVAQLVLYIGRLSADVVRGRLLLKIGNYINMSLVSGFLTKLMKMSVNFFDTKFAGDLIQRINDHKRIENFMTTTTLNILFDSFNMLVFSIILISYDFRIFLIFVTGAILYVFYCYRFLQKRGELDHQRFVQLSDNQNKIMEIIKGMPDIKLNGCENRKRLEWEIIQEKLFKVNTKVLKLSQNQQTGSAFINELKNIIITILVAGNVINGEMSLGMMLSVQYIIGQMNSPIEQLVGFINSWQDAKISLERFWEIHGKEDEKTGEIIILPQKPDIVISELSFQYEGPYSAKVLNKVNMVIGHNKVTAIVGSSGSGKTTLLKLLFGFYQPVEGQIVIGDTNLSKIDIGLWRKKCGTVLQDGFLFSDTIARNISVSSEVIDLQKLYQAVNIANIQDLIDGLPLGLDTMIGDKGNGLSQGQKQRILIARAVYKNPEFLFFDEATNALDAYNEKVIMNNLSRFFKGRTVVIVAHRLSTVKNADKIVVLHKGEIIETGTHNDLVKKQGVYLDLVRNQLELAA